MTRRLIGTWSPANEGQFMVTPRRKTGCARKAYRPAEKALPPVYVVKVDHASRRAYRMIPSGGPRNLHRTYQPAALRGER